MNKEELKEEARILQRDLRALKEINHPLYDYELFRAAKWLREEAGWHAEVEYVRYTGTYIAIIMEKEYRGNKIELIENERPMVHFYSYEQALEAAVEVALKHIIHPINCESR